MRRRARHHFGATLAFPILIVVATALVICATRAVLHPRVDSPNFVDAIVVVAGAMDDRYAHARQLALQGVADHLLISQPATEDGRFGALSRHCNPDFVAGSARRIETECFVPDSNTTEGEAAAATRIARERNWSSLLVVTYWGHVSRVRIYFMQCFTGAVHVTDTPDPAPRSRRVAIQHETGGYVKAILKPAC